MVSPAALGSAALLALVCAGASVAATAPSARDATGEAYPARPIRFVVPFPPGGGDTVARIVAGVLGERLGRNLVVDNRPGAGSTLGTDMVAKAPPDGYTILFATSAFAIAAAVYPKLPYDPVKDFAPVASVAFAPNVLVLHPSVPVTSVKELIAYAKARPNALNYASNGSGSITFVAAELFKSMAGINVTEITYKGAGPSVAALLGGEVQMMFAPLGPTVPHVKSGRLRALGMLHDKRSPVLPDLPTIAEAGLPGYSAANWYGVAAPRDTPRAIVELLNQRIVAVLGTDEVGSRFAALGYEPTPSTAQAFGQFVREEIAKWSRVVKQAGVKPN